MSDMRGILDVFRRIDAEVARIEAAKPQPCPGGRILKVRREMVARDTDYPETLSSRYTVTIECGHERRYWVKRHAYAGSSPCQQAAS